MLADPRVSAGVAVIGCPDYMSLLSDRARLSKLSTYTADDGASFLGSRDFPPALIEACKKYDPKALLFGTDHVPPPPPASPTASEQDGRQRLEATLRARVRGKKFLLCSGAEDKVVPYQCGRPFVDWFKGAADAWFGARGEDAIVVRDVLYPGTGHTFSAAMIQDAVRFVVDVVAGGDGRVALAETAGGGEERRVSKI
ncbi:hypothetical protein VTK73DRAFT_2794 [Phialemonium thermophilum]|uniref:Uncharacterized protein n=1 Tax=Phialemonium thermophilum TaxID=223376 RepID=A0ABR3VP20_9PEZI